MATMQLDFFALPDTQPAQPTYYLGTCLRCHTTQRSTEATPFRPCKAVTCAATVTMRKIQAVYHAGTRCDARCMSAKGPLCECSCMGKNHGRLG